MTHGWRIILFKHKRVSWMVESWDNLDWHFVAQFVQVGSGLKYYMNFNTIWPKHSLKNYKCLKSILSLAHDMFDVSGDQNIRSVSDDWGEAWANPGHHPDGPAAEGGGEARVCVMLLVPGGHVLLVGGASLGDPYNVIQMTNLFSV